MKNLSILFALLLAILLPCSCSSDLSETGSYGSISGSVSDATTGEPVSTVNVRLIPGGNSTVTGTDGSFTFRNLTPMDYTIEISKEGYKASTADVSVRNGEPTEAHLLIERIPDIVTADRKTLDFGDNQSLNTLSFNIVNSGYEDMDWEIEERCDWITEVKPAKGTLAYGKTEGIVVVIDRKALKAGENKATIVIRSSKGSSQMGVIAIGQDTSLPQLNVLEVTDITPKSVTFNGHILYSGRPSYTERGFVYSDTQMPSIDNCLAKIICPVNNTSKYTYNVSGLKNNHKYYVKAYAINDVGIAYSSNEVSFMTTMSMPEVATLDISNVNFSAGTATLRGEVTFAGDPAYTERGFVYGTMSNPTVSDHKVVANGAGVIGTYSKYVSNLPKSTYYVRAYVTSTGGTVYGKEIEVKPDWIEIQSAGIAVQSQDLGSGTWVTANSMCANSRVGGFTDWRLPTMDELMVLYNNRKIIGGFSDDYYWSNMYYGYDDEMDRHYYICISFYDGELSAAASYKSLHVRAVRTIK